MGKIERRMLVGALLGALAMLGIAGFADSGPVAAPPHPVPVVVDSHYRVTSWVGGTAEVVGAQARTESRFTSPVPVGGLRRS
ncbi:MAG TPA: hypothetical protein VJX66_08420 [Amycolatopsis sp.]|nr:hypothetical protein [Amycolatopsis sp.]